MTQLVLLQTEAGSLLDKVIVAATAPLITVLVGGLVVWGITYRIQNKNAQRIRDQDLRRAQDVLSQSRADRDEEIRHELVTEMTQAAGALYLVTQHFWRVKSELTDGPADAHRLSKVRETLDATYLEARKAGETTESRLLGYFTTSDPRDKYHAAMDCLTVRYFQLIDRATPTLYEKNKGEAHTGLEVAQMRYPEELLARYLAASREAVQSVFSTPLRRRSEAELPADQSGPVGHPQSR